MSRRDIGSAIHRGTWKVCAASVRGLSHENSGQVCQDTSRFQVLIGDVLVAAIADGAGSADYGDIGSDIATEAAIDYVVRSYDAEGESNFDPGRWSELLAGASAEAFDVIADWARQLGENIALFNTTLIIVTATPAGVAAYQIGDGSVVLQTSDGEFIEMTSPMHGEYVNTTTFLTSVDAKDHAQIEVRCGPVAALAMFTDGLEAVALERIHARAFPPFFDRLFTVCRNEQDLEKLETGLRDFLGSDRIRERCDDDLTLLVAVIGERDGE